MKGMEYEGALSMWLAINMAEGEASVLLNAQSRNEMINYCKECVLGVNIPNEGLREISDLAAW